MSLKTKIIEECLKTLKRDDVKEETGAAEGEGDAEDVLMSI